MPQAKSAVLAVHYSSNMMGTDVLVVEPSLEQNLGAAHGQKM